MSNGYEIKADLVIAIQTMDSLLFKTTLEKSTIPLISIADYNGSGIFHELASAILSESFELELVKIYVSLFYIKYTEKAQEMIKIQINKTTLTENLTPVMIAINGNKLVN